MEVSFVNQGKRTSMAVTLRDVAVAANVSVSTASRALKGSPQISSETRAVVEKAAAAMSYRPNKAASALRSNRSQLVGLVLNNLVNASFHTIAEVVQRRLADEGYQLILGTTDADPHKERALLQTLADHGVDGVIVIGSGQNASTTNAMLTEGIAVVNAIRSSKDSASPTVLAGDRGGAFEATEYLISRGHRKIGFIGAPETTDSGRERIAGYRDALERNGLTFDPAFIVQGPFNQQFGAEAARRLLDESPGMTALFAANHEAVFGILPTLVARGIRIPDDLSLVCYEDMNLLQMWQPPISTVDNGAHQLADLSVDLLLRQIRTRSNPKASSEADEGNSRTYRVGARLIKRESVSTINQA
jgi:LacI family transcriptional regulator